MTKWEMVKIEFRSVGKKSIIGPELGSFFALAVTPNGEKVIDQTLGLKHDDQRRWDERQKLEGRLLANGWEPLSVDKHGSVQTLRRQSG